MCIYIPIVYTYICKNDQSYCKIKQRNMRPKSIYINYINYIYQYVSNAPIIGSAIGIGLIDNSIKNEYRYRLKMLKTRPIIHVLVHVFEHVCD